MGVAPEAAAAALARFENVRRRLELRGEAAGIKVYDDFAHHPTAMRTTIDGLRRKRSAYRRAPQRILAVFEPRSNTMKLGTMKAQLPWALEEADLSLLPAGRLRLGRRSGAGADGRAGGGAPTAWTSWSRTSCARPAPGDHVLCMSNGGFGGIHGKLLAALQARR